MLSFGPFKLDPSNEQLWRGHELVTLKPKAFAVLRYLVERSQRLVTKDELLQQFWSDVHVGDAVLKTHMAEIRRALGDDIKSPRFIETAHRRGYRFIAALRVGASPAANSDGAVAAKHSQPANSLTPDALAPTRGRPNSTFVGRQLELQRLDTCLARALQGPLQAVFLSGDAGAGKTTLANEFLARLEAHADLWLARGQCVEQYGASEAYLPVLEALGRLCRRHGKERIVEVLRRQAPSWLTQLSGVLDAAELAALAATGSATPERMLREIADAVLTISEERGLVLLFEDLQWADPSTLNLISYLARRSDPARVLLLGTYRQHEASAKGHPLVSIQQDLQVSGRGEEIALTQLSQQALSEYLDARFPAHRFPAQLVAVLHERTSGSPLFVARLVDYWLECGWLVERSAAWQLGVELEQLVRGVPTSLSRMIERELERLPQFDRSVLEVASVLGVEFSVSTVAAVLEADLAETEELCLGWARKGQLLRTLGPSQASDERVSLRCAFAHGLYQQVAYERIGPVRIANLHLRVGQRLEAGQAGSVEALAPELALHFERGQAYSAAVRCSMLAAQRALSRSGYREALDHVLRGLALLPRLPSDAERLQCELQLELMRGAMLGMTKGFATPEAENSYARCRELCSLVGEGASLLPVVLEGIWKFYLLRGDCRTISELEAQISALAEEGRDPRASVQARAIRTITYCHLGRFREARALGEAVLPDLDAHCTNLRLTLYGEDPRILVGGHLPWALWSLGYPERALAVADQTVVIARQSGHPFTRVSALYFRCIVLGIRREYAKCLEATDELFQVAATYEFPLFTSMATMLRASAVAANGQVRLGLSLFEEGWKVYCITGAGSANFPSIWAELLALDGQFNRALEVVAEEFDRYRKGFQVWAPWLYRCRGEITWRFVQNGRIDAASAERDFKTALDLARASEARSLELLAAMSLARLWRGQGKSREAYALLAPIYAAFTEGWDTPDLRDAAQLLAELSREGAIALSLN
jgi:DNA-binding winged helix-turn-helix (wHTH) protein